MDRIRVWRSKGKPDMVIVGSLLSAPYQVDRGTRRRKATGEDHLTAVQLKWPPNAECRQLLSLVLVYRKQTGSSVLHFKTAPDLRLGTQSSPHCPRSMLAHHNIEQSDQTGAFQVLQTHKTSSPQTASDSVVSVLRLRKRRLFENRRRK